MPEKTTGYIYMSDTCTNVSEGRINVELSESKENIKKRGDESPLFLCDAPEFWDRFSEGSLALSAIHGATPHFVLMSF